jgi:hypothetical protein
MTETLFIRLLREDDKGTALAERIAAMRDGDAVEDIHTVDPESFRQVPNTPFCYWVSERIRRLFKELPPFESEGRTVKQGLATADDFRFVRAWWEVPAERILDSMRYAAGGMQEKQEEKWTEKRTREFQEWCRKRTYEGKRWVPFAKGGEYSPYYADIHLVVNWENEGAEIRHFVDPKTGKTNSRPQNTDYYFRPGLTYACRVRRFSTAIVPAGCVFSHVAQMMFLPDADELPGACAFYSSLGIRFLLSLLTITRKYEVGLIKFLPYLHSEKMKAIGIDQIIEFQSKSQTSETARLSTSGFFAKKNGYSNATTEVVDKDSLALLGLSDDEEKVRLLVHTFEQLSASQDETPTELERTDECALEVGPSNPWSEVLSYVVGAVMGRWDVRIAIDQSLAPKLPDPFDPLPVCPPGMLVGPDGLPAEPNRIVSEEWLRARSDANTLPPEGSVKNPTIPDSEYPLRISWDGILVDDPGFNGDRPHRDDIVRRVREVFDLLWKDKAHEIEQEACDILGVSDLRDYFRKPAGFFQDHLKRYSKSRRKAPIYWPLSTASGSYTVWLYYHRLTDQTLYMVVNKYVEPKISEVERGIGGIENDLKSASGRDATRLTDRLNEARAFLGELRELREELLRIAALPFKPDLNDGVIINASPFHNLFRLRSWAKDTEDCWKKLAEGDYDWAHLAYTIWPDRVREVCKRDRSIAVAHGLEDLCEVETPESKKKGGRGRRKREAAR